MFLEHGVAPNALNTMSLYEITTMMKALLARRAPQQKTVTDEEWQTAANMLKAVTTSDPNVKLGGF